MRFGKWRGMPLAAAVAVCLGLGLTSTVHADGGLFHYHHTLPGEVPAYDFATGGEYLAPPVPYGHYAKDHFGRGCTRPGACCWACCHGCGLGHGCGLMVVAPVTAAAWAMVAEGTAATVAASAPEKGCSTTAMAAAADRRIAAGGLCELAARPRPQEELRSLPRLDRCGNQSDSACRASGRHAVRPGPLPPLRRSGLRHLRRHGCR